MNKTTDAYLSSGNKKKYLNDYENNYDIAVTGIGIKTSNAEDIHEFWKLIKTEYCFIQEIPESRKQLTDDYLNHQGYCEDQYHYEKAAYMDSISEFDYEYFHISPKEASLMDPAQRIFLQTAYHAIQHAGFSSRITGSDTGVFLGYAGESEYKKMILDMEPQNYSIGTVGNIAGISIGRLSHMLNLHGPAILYNTACSSSLVALHYACQAIRNNECSQALVGGIQVYPLPVRYSEIGIESADGKTRAFDDNASGTGGGEGCAVVLLRRLKDAVQDGDSIYAVVKGSAVNHDGTSNGLTSPNPLAQEKVICKAWENAKINPTTLSYIEAHGTATQIGDPIEIDGLTRAFRKYTKRKGFCAIGTIKSNLGHTDAASGIMGFVKVVLALYHKIIPATLHFQKPNRSINFMDSPFYVAAETEQWICDNTPRRCGVNSFSIMGTNCHVVLEEYINTCQREMPDMQQYILPLSAKSRQSLFTLLEKYETFPFYDQSIDDICFTAACGRTHHQYRIAIICSSIEDLRDKICRIKTVEDLSKGYPWCFSTFHDNQFEFTEKPELGTICLCYISGKAYDWRRLYQAETFKYVDIPVYPFEKKNCWLDILPKEKDNFFHIQEWVEKQQHSSPATSSKIAIVASVGAVAESLKQAFMNHGDEAVIFNQERDNLSLNCDQQFYLNLGRELCIGGFTKIVFSVLRDKSGHSLSLDEIANISQQYARQLMLLIRALRQNSCKAMDIVILTENLHCVTGEEQDILPVSSMMEGIGKAIFYEQTSYRCRIIDLDKYTDFTSVLYDVLCDYQEYMTAFRRNVRYVPVIKQIKLMQSESERTLFRTNGTYVVAGGLGDIGIEVAKAIAEKMPVNLVLISRSKFPERQLWEEKQHKEQFDSIIKQLLLIENMGSQILHLTADIADKKSLAAALNEVRLRFGKIDGIINSAGIGSGMSGSSLLQMTDEEMNEVCKTKVAGICNLHELTLEDSLSFFVMFSSPITITGGIQSGSYIAANSFVDAFTRYRQQKFSNTYCISWAPWLKTIKRYNNQFDSKYHLFFPLDEKRAMSAMMEVLGRNIHYVYIGEMNYCSRIFDVMNNMPFFIDMDMKHAVSSQEINTLTNIINHVVLEGRDNHTYTATEEKAAQILANTLGYSKLNVNASIYDLGIDSILAIKIINDVASCLGCDIRIDELLQNPILDDFLKIVEQKCVFNHALVQVERSDERLFYPLSSAQQRLYMIHQRADARGDWHISYQFEIEGELDIQRLQTAFEKVINCHEILRTSFHFIEGNAVQKIHETLYFKIETLDSHLNILPDIVFQLDKPPLFKVYILNLQGRNKILYFAIHHIIADEVSMLYMFQYLSDAYRGKVLEQPEIQYRDYAVWQKQKLSEGYFQVQERYWISQFEGEIPCLDYPLDYERPKRQTFRGKVEYFHFNADITKDLKQLAQEHCSSAYWVLMAVLYTVLFKVTSNDDIVIGMPVYGRENPAYQSLLGMFVNVLPLRNNISNLMRFSDFFNQVKDSILSAFKNQQYPFDTLVEKLKVKQRPGRNLFFDISFQKLQGKMQQMALDEKVTLVEKQHDNLVANQDIMLELISENEIMEFRIVYNCEILHVDSIQNLITFFETVTKQIIKKFDSKISDLQLVNINKNEYLYQSVMKRLK